jgi:UDP-3-O-[3-hydroxymyristoyl] N-acetylglucosamine deacetylase
MRQQRTLRHVIGCAGVGLHSGARVSLTLRPAAEGSGIRFRRVDRPGAPTIPASVEHAVADGLVANPDDRVAASVRMVEHLMAALVACEIDNALVEISGPELPAMDGSARPFVLLIECAGTVQQDQPAPRLEVLRPVSVEAGASYARLEPGRGLELVVEPGAENASRRFQFRFSPEACKSELVAARETACGAASGVARGGSRFADEPARHAALDALGDLGLVPARVEGRYVESGGDPGLRRSLLRRLLGDQRNWRVHGGAIRDVLAFPRGTLVPQPRAA